MKVATDASIYEIEPKQVVYPKNCDDLIKVIRKLLSSKQSFTMRVGGTSIGGQSTGSGTLVDISKYLTNIIDFREDGHTTSLFLDYSIMIIKALCLREILQNIQRIELACLIPNLINREMLLK